MQSAGLSFFLLIPCLLAVHSAMAGAVIANLSVADDNLSRQQLRAVFSLSKQYWRDRQLIKVAVRASDDPSHVHFSRKTLGIFPYQLQRNWDRLTFSGMAMPPRQVGSDQEMLRYIENQPGAIGYISDPQLLSHRSGVKLVEID